MEALVLMKQYVYAMRPTNFTMELLTHVKHVQLIRYRQSIHACVLKRTFPSIPHLIRAIFLVLTAPLLLTCRRVLIVLQMPWFAKMILCTVAYLNIIINR